MLSLRPYQRPTSTAEIPGMSPDPADYARTSRERELARQLRRLPEDDRFGSVDK